MVFLLQVSNKQHLVIDIGNSRIKYGHFSGSDLIVASTWSSLGEIAKYCYDLQPDNIGIISVGMSSDKIAEELSQLPIEFITTKSKLPITLDYETPETLGIDRVAACIGAQVIYPNQPVLVIDIGTCITYDILDDTGTYRGGVIAPGLKMRMKAMHAQTHNLPDISFDWTMHIGDGPGKSTKSCLARGAYRAIIHEIKGFINDFESKYPELAVILTGGDAIHFESKLKEPIFADLNLVLKGINTILNQ